MKAGYVHATGGQFGYHGVLRDRKGRETWRCPHLHLCAKNGAYSPMYPRHEESARECAEKHAMDAAL